MPDCDYCEQSFADEGSLLEHMGDAHEGELGRIDQRRVDEHYGEDGGLSTTITYAIVGIVIVAVIGGAVYAAVAAFGGGEQLVHEHGTINMTVDGEQVDFHQYSDETEAFHFHPGDEHWHMEPREPGRLTLADALSRLDIVVREDRVSIDGQTYEESDAGTEITIEVNGEPVDPTSYTLQEGDHVRIAVQTSN